MSDRYTSPKLSSNRREKGHHPRHPPRISNRNGQMSRGKEEERRDDIGKSGRTAKRSVCTIEIFRVVRDSIRQESTRVCELTRLINTDYSITMEEN
uniref:Uncharacterized protein n=1 Tax=Romanomermis culicivorax TaxID=13658 RepID=A0A915IBY2_ROMCU